MEDLPRYVHKEPRLPILLDRMKRSGAGVFLVTNSDYTYTNVLMTFLFDVPLPKNMPFKEWNTYFDLIVVSACKPLFFEEGSILREVDMQTGRLKIGQFAGCETRGKVFSGGSTEVFDTLLGAKHKVCARLVPC